MLRLVFLFVLFQTTALVANEFRELFKIALQKDEQKKILVKYANKDRLFEFYWTLYSNGGLVTFYRYDGFVSQNILYLNHKNQSIRIRLRDDGVAFHKLPYFILRFQEFDAKKNKAKFELFLYDDKEQMRLKFLKNKQ